MRFFRIGKRRKELVEVLSDDHGIFRTTATIQLDDEAQREIDSGHPHTIVIPGEVINQDTEEN
jgi:hypothetical protein